MSTFFDVETGYDFVTINGNSYDGFDNEIVNDLVPAHFTVTFTSDYAQTWEGFTLVWECEDMHILNV